MSARRLLDIYTLMERLQREKPGGFALCAVAAEFMMLDGAGIALLGEGGVLTPLCTSNHSASGLMDLELNLSEGPMVDAGRGDAIQDTDLIEVTSPKWTAYRPEAVALGARAVFSYPVRLGAIRFGVLCLFRSTPGPLNAQQSTDGYLMASVVARAILSELAGGSLMGLVGESNGDSILDFRVHQAAGMLSVQGSLSVKDALVLLRARAFGTGQQLSDLADGVVTGATRFESTTREWIDGPTFGNHDK